MTQGAGLYIAVSAAFLLLAASGIILLWRILGAISKIGNAKAPALDGRFKKDFPIQLLAIEADSSAVLCWSSEVESLRKERDELEASLRKLLTEGLSGRLGRQLVSLKEATETLRKNSDRRRRAGSSRRTED
jgi:hypothetical protein